MTAIVSMDRWQYPIGMLNSSMTCSAVKIVTNVAAEKNINVLCVKIFLQAQAPCGKALGSAMNNGVNVTSASCNTDQGLQQK